MICKVHSFCSLLLQPLIRTDLTEILAVPCYDGCYLPKQENVFVHTVLEDLDTFLQRGDQKSILLFPPLPSRLRFLIHKTVEDYPNLSTFSVGEGWSRRVVVCCSHLRLPAEYDSSDTDAGVQEQPSMRRRPAGDRTGDLTPKRRPSRGGRKPDKAIYVPLALRQRALGSSQGVHPAELSSSTCSLSVSASEGSASDPAEIDPSTNHEPVADGADESAGEPDRCRVSASGPSLSPPAWDQTVSYFMAMTLEDQAKDDVDDSMTPAVESDSTQESREDAGDFTQEIMANVKEGDVVIVGAQNDYSSFENVWISQDDFAHVIEIYDFPAMFKTDDLLDAFADYSDGGMKIKWVDNTHALGVFSSEAAALQALSIRHPLLRTRTLSEGSKRAKGKAVRRAEYLLPVRERPRTDTAVARRMVTRALGLRGGPRGKRF